MESARNAVVGVGAEFSGRPTETAVFEFTVTPSRRLVDYNDKTNGPTFDDLWGRGWRPLHWDWERENNKYVVVMQHDSERPE